MADPIATSRWLSPNPADPQSWNKYAYVEYQPLIATDPLGLDCDPNPKNWGGAIPGTGPCSNGGTQSITVTGWPSLFDPASQPGMDDGDKKPQCDCKDDRPQPDIGHPPMITLTPKLKWWQYLLSPVHDFTDPRPDCAVVSLNAIGNHLADDFGFGPPGADASAGLAAGRRSASGTGLSLRGQ